MPEPARPCRVLVVDDDPLLRKLIVTALRRSRALDIAEAANGQEAIEKLRDAAGWQVLILDLMMPTVSGWDVLDWLAGQRTSLPGSVIVASAADRAVLQRLDPAMVNAIVFKPFDVLEFAAYVRAACGLRSRDRRKARLIA